MLKTFRVLSIIEGTSLIALFLVAMPGKYLGYFDILWDTGMVHGILWMIYFLLSLLVSHKQQWSVAFWVLALLASVIPFACFFLERKLRETEVLAEA